MMIRSLKDARRGMTLTSLALIILAVALALGFVWAEAVNYQESFDIRRSNMELQDIVRSIRAAHTSGGKIDKGENIDVRDLSTDLVGHVGDRTLVYTPWHSPLTLFPGNAMGWGIDTDQNEFTIEMEGIPSDACASIVLENADKAMIDMGLIAVYISPEIGQGNEICFASDIFCKTIVPAITKDMISSLCRARSRMTVMFTYALSR